MKYTFLRVSLLIVLASLPAVGVGAPASPSTGMVEALACAQRAVAGHTGTLFRSLELAGKVLVTTATTPQAPRPLIIRYLQPDKYLRSELQHTRSGDIQRIKGFNGARLLNAVKVSNPGEQQFGGTWGPEQLPIEQRAAAILLLGLVAWPLAGVTAPAPVGTGASGTVMASIGGRQVSLHLADDCIPVSVSYKAQVRLPPEAGARSLPPAVEADVRVAFEQRRRVNGLLLPYRITTTANGTMLEQITVDRYRIDSGFDADTFERIDGPRGGDK
jgi:hypothetical protein